jgi:hypothetical protein
VIHLFVNGGALCGASGTYHWTVAPGAVSCPRCAARLCTVIAMAPARTGRAAPRAVAPSGEVARDREGRWGTVIPLRR